MLTLKYVRVLIRRPRKRTLHPNCLTRSAKQPTSRRWWPSRSPAFSAREPDFTFETKMPLWLPPTSAMSFSRLSPTTVSSCTGFREELILEKDDSDGRKGLRCQRIWPKHVVNHLERFEPEGKSTRKSVRTKTRLSRESFLKMLLTCSRS